MLLSDCQTMKEADRLAIEIAEIPSTLLMTNAAKAVAETALEYLVLGEKALIFCGTGNNGGDGIATAVQLLKWGFESFVYLVGNPDKMTPDAREMERRLQEMGSSIRLFDSNADFSEIMSESGVIIDALFGVGLSRQISDDALQAVLLMNGCSLPVVSCDIPSGVNADSGEILGVAVHADSTVTFSMAKVGHFASPGSTYCGKLKIADIGIPAEFLCGCGIKAVTINDLNIPPRDKISHKGNYGKVLIVGGSVGYSGAPTLSAKAALRSGAGLVSVGVPESIYQITAIKNEEAMPFPLAGGDDGKLSVTALPVLLEHLNSSDVAVIGPGLGRSDSVSEIVINTIENCRCPLIIDADALYAIREDCSILRRSPALCIITPHEGEFSRLTGLTCTNRIEQAYSFAKEYQCIVVLKGYGTVIAFPNGDIYINSTGGPSLAKGGTGDVLTGMIAALLCRLPLRQAVTSAVWLHGRAGDICSEKYGENSVMALDVIETIPQAMKEIT